MTAISVITAVRDAAATIGDCLESIEGQKWPVEHILVDGQSSDGTLGIVERYREGIAKIVSEPDSGVYDALNKGIGLATGDVVGVLHADDFYAGPDVLSRVAEIFQDDRIDSCYGDLVYVDRSDPARVIRRWITGPYHERRFYEGWMPPHPTFFARRRVYERYGLFNLSLGSAADYELMLRFLVKHRITTAYIPEVLVKMRSGGLSNASIKNRLRAHRMDRQAWRVNGLKPELLTLPLKPLSKVGQFLFRSLRPPACR